MDSDITSNKMTFLRDKQGNIVVWQWPNVLLWAWIVIAVSNILLADSQLKDALQQLATAVLFTWSYMEITEGVNYLRRTLGVIVLVGIVVGYFVEL